jgi:hypothetical protein
MTLRIAAFLLVFLATNVLAATRLDELAARPNPVAPGKPVEIAVTVERGQFDKQPCEVLVEPGDGAKPLKLTFAISEPRTKKLIYTYAKPGSYNLKAVAGYGCGGSRSVSLAVRTEGEIAAAEAKAAETKAAAEMPPHTGPGCPPGWWMVPESVQGARYACRPNLPSRPLSCAGGTTYYSENGVIGCR